MTYTATYTDSDLGAVAIDIIVKVMVALGALATLFGLVIAWRFFTTGKLKVK